MPNPPNATGEKPTDTKPIKLYDNPAVRDLEDQALIENWPLDSFDSEQQHSIDTVCGKLFGICESELRPVWPPEIARLGYDEAVPVHLEETCERLEREEREFEKKFQTRKLSDAATVEFLRKAGLDLTGPTGAPLHILRALSTVCEAVVRGIAGKLPDRAETDLDQLEDQLRREVQRFKRDGAAA